MTPVLIGKTRHSRSTPWMWPHPPAGYWLNMDLSQNLFSVVTSAAVRVYDDEYTLLRTWNYASALDGLYVGQLFGNEWCEDADGKFWVIMKNGAGLPSAASTWKLIRLSLTSDSREFDFSLPTPNTATDGIQPGAGANVPFAMDALAQPWVPTRSGLRRLSPSDGSVQETIAWPRTLVTPFASPGATDWVLQNLVGGANGVIIQLRNVDGGGNVTYEFYFFLWGDSAFGSVFLSEVNPNPDIRHLFSADPLQTDGEDTFGGVGVYNTGNYRQQFWFVTQGGVRTARTQPGASTGDFQYGPGALLGNHYWLQRNNGTNASSTIVDLSRYDRTADLFEHNGETLVGFMPTNQSCFRVGQPPAS